MVAERLHAIQLSMKMVKNLVDAASLEDLLLGNVVPSLSFMNQDELLTGASSSHLGRTTRVRYTLSDQAMRK